MKTRQKFLTVVGGALALASFLAAEGPLNEAARKGDLDQIKTYLASNKVDLNKAEGDCFPLLHEASLFGHVDVIKYLVDQGAKVKVGAAFFAQSEPVQPLHAAFMGAQKGVVDYFVKEHGFKPTALFKIKGIMYPNPKGKTHEFNAIHLALFFHFLMGQSIDEASDHEKSFFDPKRLYDFVRHMEKQGVPLSNQLPRIEQGDDSESLMTHLVAGLGAVDLLKYLVEEKTFRLQSTNDDKEATPMHMAARVGSVATMKYLASKGYSLTSVRRNDQPIQEAATHCGDKEKVFEVVEYILSEAEVETKILERLWRSFTNKYGSNKKAAELVEAQLRQRGWEPPK